MKYKIIESYANKLNKGWILNDQESGILYIYEIRYASPIDAYGLRIAQIAETEFIDVAENGQVVKAPVIIELNMNDPQESIDKLIKIALLNVQ